MSGQIHRQKKNKDFVTIDTHCLRNPALKWDAKGLHSYLMQLPDDWKINIADLEKRSETGRDGTRAALNALLSAGYIFRERKQGGGGKFEGYDYHLFERPEHAEEWKTVNGKAVNGFADDGLTVNGKADATKYEESPTDFIKNEKTKDEEKAASPFPLPENENQTLKAEKNENDLQTGAGGAAGENPLTPPFTPVGTIEPKGATVVRMYDPQLPAVTIVDSVPATYETRRGKPQNRHEPHVHPENENIFAHFTEPERAKTLWVEWLKYKWGEKKQKYKTPQTELTALRRLWECSHGETPKAAEIIETAVANLWQGFFKPKEEKQFKNKAVENHATLANIVLESRRAAFGQRDGE